jgi:hypothetical protein
MSDFGLRSTESYARLGNATFVVQVWGDTTGDDHDDIAFTEHPDLGSARAWAGANLALYQRATSAVWAEVRRGIWVDDSYHNDESNYVLDEVWEIDKAAVIWRACLNSDKTVNWQEG